MSRAIDAHAHVIVPRDHAQRPPRRRGLAPARPARGRAARWSSSAGARSARWSTRWSTSRRSSRSRRARGVGGVVLCPFVPLLFAERRARGLPRALPDPEPAPSARWWRPTRAAIAALGAVPLQDPELAADELLALRRRGDRSPGSRSPRASAGPTSATPASNRSGRRRRETGALVFIHPTTRGFEQPVFGGHYLWNTVGNPLETTIAAAQMTMSGVLERHPDLRVLLAHGGGALLALRGRLRPLARLPARRPSRAARESRSPRSGASTSTPSPTTASCCGR